MTIIIALRKMRQSHESYFMCPRKLPPKLLSATLPFTNGGFCENPVLPRLLMRRCASIFDCNIRLFNNITPQKCYVKVLK